MLREGSEQKFPWPLASVQHWFCGYITYEAGVVYQNFYNNHAGAIDKLAKVWEFIAKEFKDEDNVIGYNILNEPWAGNVYKVKKFIYISEARMFKVFCHRNFFVNSYKEFVFRALKAILGCLK